LATSNEQVQALRERQNASARVLLDTGDYRCANMGDVAMLQVAVQRLREQMPQATIEVMTEDPGALALYCPDARPVSCEGRRIWFADRDLLGRIHRLLPRRVSNGVVGLKRLMRNRWPAVLAEIIVARRRLRRSEGPEEHRRFLEAVSRANLVAVTGAGGITDHAWQWSDQMFNLLELAIARGIPTVLFGHGLGPLTNPELLQRAERLLPKVRLIALRERRFGVEILRSLGVPDSRVLVTGDDAIELAHAAAPSALGGGIGVNLRVSRSAGVEEGMVKQVRRPLHEFARQRKAPLVPVPISFYGGADGAEVLWRRGAAAAPFVFTPGIDDLSDCSAIARLMAGYQDPSDAGQGLNTPRKVIDAIGRCRIVVTGAYHAAVFALAQGIPSVCLAKSRYFMDKFLGLADEFGIGCEVLSLDTSDFSAVLLDALARSWSEADQVRAPLLQAAVRQIALSRAAYARAAALVVRAPRRAAAKQEESGS
jgi:colanic acid/amylovoran biosynthesis protein